MDENGDKKIFISEIRKRPILWSREFGRDRDREAVAKSWNEISEVLGVSVYTLKKEWLNLRTSYGREHKKVFGDTLRKEPIEQPNYQYFDSLNFLKDHIRHYRKKRKRYVQVKGPGKRNEVGLTEGCRTLNPILMKRRDVLNHAKHVSVLKRKRGRPRKNVNPQASSIVPHSCAGTPSKPNSCAGTPSKPNSRAGTPSKPNSHTSTPSKSNSCTSTPSMPDLIPAAISTFSTAVKDSGESSTNQVSTVNVPGNLTDMKSYVQSILDPHEQAATVLNTAKQDVSLQKSNESQKQKSKVWNLLDTKKGNKPKFISLQNRIGLRQKYVRKKKRHINSTGNRFVMEIPEEDIASLNFFKSLVPQLKNFTSQETCLFRMEVLKLLSDIISSRQALQCQTQMACGLHTKYS